jgi:hypothetical protein
MNNNPINQYGNLNYQSMNSYIDNLFVRHGRLLVLRIDLSYQQNINCNGLQAKEDFELLINTMHSNNVFNHLCGYAWKLEYGVSKGFHYHVILFFDGSKVRQDISRAKMIGEYWANNITQGKGLYYNCNLEKDKYDYCGIGMINHYDEEMIENLKNKVAWYLTKPDDYMQSIDIGETFGIGGIKWKSSNAGRPRSR